MVPLSQAYLNCIYMVLFKQRCLQAKLRQTEDAQSNSLNERT